MKHFMVMYHKVFLINNKIWLKKEDLDYYH